MARKKIIAGNWKMNKTATEAKTLVQDLITEVGNFDAADIVLCPPFTALAAVSALLDGDKRRNIWLGAQNMHHLPSGAYTGEISAPMLRDLYVRYVILGHSERRQYFGETNAVVNTKVKAVLAAALRPIMCYGETLQERESGQWKAVLEKQLREGLTGIEEKDTADLVLAYEPVWAIGTGKTATPAQAQEAHAFSRQVLKSIFPGGAADKLRIQYGGSVKPENAKELLQQPDIDGSLVGGASLEARSFVSIIKNACS